METLESRDEARNEARNQACDQACGEPCDEARASGPLPEGPDLRPVEGDGADDELAALAKALGHPARVRILRLLMRQGACRCGDLVDELPLAQSTVSQHLRVLREAGLVRGEVDGARACYCASDRAVRRLRALVAVL